MASVLRCGCNVLIVRFSAFLSEDDFPKDFLVAQDQDNGSDTFFGCIIFFSVSLWSEAAGAYTSAYLPLRERNQTHGKDGAAARQEGTGFAWNRIAGLRRVLRVVS